MDNKKEFQNLPDGMVLKEEVSLLKQELVAGRQREQRLLWILITLIAAVVIFLVLGGFWWDKAREVTAQSATAQAITQKGMQAAVNESVKEQIIAETQKTEAQKQAQIALSRQLSAQAQLLFTTDVSNQITAVLLAAESMRLHPSSDAAKIITGNKLAYPISHMTYLSYPNTYVNAVAFTPDSKYVASLGTYDNTARVWEVETGREIARMTHDLSVWSLAISPDGKYAVSGSDDDTARVWEITTGREVARMVHDGGGSVNYVAFSPNGKYVISSTGYNATLIWEAETGDEIARLKRDYSAPSVAFSPDGKYLIDNATKVSGNFTDREFIRITHDKTFSAISPDGKYAISRECNKQEASGACSHGSVLIWDVKSGEDVARLAHGGDISTVSFSPDNKYVLSGSNDTLRVWEISTGKEVVHMPHDNVAYATYSRDGNYILSGSWSGVVTVWDAKTGSDIVHINHCGPYAAFSPDGQYIASGCGSVARVWKIDADHEIARANHGNEVARMDHGHGIARVALSPDGRYIASGSVNSGWVDNIIRVWEIHTGNEISSMYQDQEIYSIAFSSDGKYLVAGSYDFTVRVWNVITGKENMHMTHDGFVYSTSFSPDGKYVASGSADHTARVWDVMTGKEISRMTHEGEVPIVAFSPDGKYVVSGGCDKLESTNTCLQGSVRVWEASTGKEISRMTHDYQILAIAFSPDGKYIVSSGDPTARVWEVSTGKEISRMTYESIVSFVAFSPDGKYAVSGGDTTRVWEADTGREIFRTMNAFPAEFSPDGRYLIAKEPNSNIVRIWDIKAKQEIIQMKHDSYVGFAAFSLDGKYAVSSEDSIIHMWLYRPEDLIADACSRATDNLTRNEWNQYIGDALLYQAICPGLPIESEPVFMPNTTPTLIPTTMPTFAPTTMP
jgi:WD40 repeat protein